MPSVAFRNFVLLNLPGEAPNGPPPWWPPAFGRAAARSALGIAILLAAAAAPPQLAAQTHSELWGVAGENWRPDSRLPDFSHAGYRRGEEAYRIPEATVSVRDFGARGDGESDDTAAFREAIAVGGGKRVLVPEGRYRLSDVLEINASGTVLQGEGPDRSVLLFVRPLQEIDPRSATTGSGLATTAWSWSGGLIRVTGSGPAAGSRIPLPEASPRGALSLALPGTPFSEGDEVILSQRDESSSHSLALHLYRDQAGDLSRFGSASVQQVFRVRGVEGARLLFDRPLRFEVRPEWQPTLARFEPGTTDVGIERLAFEFPEERYAGHWQEVGFNPVEFGGGTAHCWMREVRLLNADNGPFVNGFFSTVEDLVIEAGRRRASEANTTGHHGVTLAGGDLLCTGLRMETRFFHDVTVTRGSIGNVFSKITAVDFNMDHHRMAPYENLFTDIDAGDGGRLFGSGGAVGRGRHSAAGATFWNIRTRQTVSWPEDFGPDEMNFVALRTRERASTDAEGRWIEPIRPGSIDPPDLHLAMREHRLRQEGAPSPESGAPNPAPAETATHRWENQDGRSVEARFGGLDGEQLILVREGQSFRVPMSQLTAESQGLARRLAGEGAPARD